MAGLRNNNERSEQREFEPESQEGKKFDLRAWFVLCTITLFGRKAQKLERNPLHTTNS